MLDLANKYWDWKARKAANKPLKTEQGYTVVKIGELYAVKAYLNQYYDLAHQQFKWSKYDLCFRDCIGSRERIEKRFGKIIEQPSQE